MVSALLTAVLGMTSIAVLLGLAPRYFGDLPTSLFTLFQVMTGDGWSEITRELMETHPSPWLYSVVLNLFIAGLSTARTCPCSRR